MVFYCFIHYLTNPKLINIWTGSVFYYYKQCFSVYPLHTSFGISNYWKWKCWTKGYITLQEIAKLSSTEVVPSTWYNHVENCCPERLGQCLSSLYRGMIQPGPPHSNQCSWLISCHTFTWSLLGAIDKFLVDRWQPDLHFWFQLQSLTALSAIFGPRKHSSQLEQVWVENQQAGV